MVPLLLLPVVPCAAVYTHRATAALPATATLVGNTVCIALLLCEGHYFMMCESACAQEGVGQRLFVDGCSFSGVMVAVAVCSSASMP